MNKFIRILRIHHWSKNLFIFLGFLLAFLYVKYVEVYDIFKLLVVFLSFSFISSGNYILNDLLDIKFDSNNPLKKNRMLTKKMIPKKYSIIFMILLWIVGLFIPFIFLEPKKTIFGFIILFSGILYNVKPFRLKSIAILDVLSESINSPIRMYAGWVILTGEYMNIWIILFSFFYTCVFMNSKRLAEYQFIKSDKKLCRETFSFYNQNKFLLLFSAYLSLTMFSLIMFFSEINLLIIILSILIFIQLIWYNNLALKGNVYVQKPVYAFKIPSFTIYSLFTFGLFLVVLIFI